MVGLVGLVGFWGTSRVGISTSSLSNSVGASSLSNLVGASSLFSLVGASSLFSLTLLVFLD